MQTLDEEPRLVEAVENLRLIRQIMERSTLHSSLSGRSGLLVGLWAVLGVLATRFAVYGNDSLALPKDHLWMLAVTWLVVLAASVATDFLLTKRRASEVGKRVFSPLGAHIVQAAAPGFTAGLVLTIFLLSRGQIAGVWGYWMLCYGLAICAVGLFSVRPVAFLGWSFLAAGAITLFLPPLWGLWMMAVSFGGFHALYGLYTGLSRSDW